jgi:hypothetical protein
LAESEDAMSGEAKKDEFVWLVLDAHGAVVAARRTKPDAESTARMHNQVGADDRRKPYRVEARKT